MAELNRVARRVALSASLALVAAFAIAAPLKPAVADDDWRHNGQWHGGGHEHGDRDWRHGWYGGYGGYGGGAIIARRPITTRHRRSTTTHRLRSITHRRRS